MEREGLGHDGETTRAQIPTWIFQPGVIAQRAAVASAMSARRHGLRECYLDRAERVTPGAGTFITVRRRCWNG